jgi:phage-related protein
MSNLTYTLSSRASRKPLVWLHGKVRTPPFSVAGRHEIGRLLDLLQRGASLAMPASRPMPVIGPRVHELRVTDASVAWRLIYRLDPDAVVVVDVVQKQTMTTPRRVIDDCQRRLNRYDLDSED